MTPTFVESKIDKKGRQTIICCLECRVSERTGICRGKQLILINDHIRQTASIYRDSYLEEHFKGEVLSLGEFEKWIANHGYKPVEHGKCSQTMKEYEEKFRRK